MGIQQILLVALVAIVVGIATILAINIFEAQAKKNHQDQLKIQMLEIVGNVIAYRYKPESMGGGGGSLLGYMPPGGEDNPRSGSDQDDRHFVKFSNDLATFFVELYDADWDDIAVKIIASSAIYGDQHPFPANAGNARITACFNQYGSLHTGPGFCPDVPGFAIDGSW